MRVTGPRMVVVGGGILGTMHAVMARRAGWEVRHLERDLEPRGATVRNFGLVWVSGRAPGPELAAALRARHLWAELATSAPGVGFRPDGSLTVVTTEAEHAVLEEVCERSDADARGFELLDPDTARRRNPLLLGELRAALWCAADAVVEPRQVLPALRAHLLDDREYRWLPGSTVVAIDSGRVVDRHGVVHGADVVVVCPGSVADGPVAALVADAPLRRVQLQMMETSTLGHRLPTSVADGDSLRYYPAFDVPARADLEPQHDLAASFDLQLLVSQRASGALTVGDTHRRDEPFDFALDDRPYAELTRRVEAILGTAMPPIARRWSGVYSQHTDGGLCHRDEPIPGVWLVTGPGGRGMTLSPAIAEATLTEVGATAGVSVAGR